MKQLVPIVTYLNDMCVCCSEIVFIHKQLAVISFQIKSKMYAHSSKTVSVVNLHFISFVCPLSVHGGKGVRHTANEDTPPEKRKAPSVRHSSAQPRHPSYQTLVINLVNRNFWLQANFSHHTTLFPVLSLQLFETGADITRL